MLPPAVCCQQVVRLENMDDTEFLALFKHHAFSGVEIEDQLLRTKLESFGDLVHHSTKHQSVPAKTTEKLESC
jgi:hypothetical protein